MEWSYVSMRHNATDILFWSAVGVGGLAMVLPLVLGVARPIAVVFLIGAVLFTLWIQWQNGRGGFGSVRGGLRPTYDTRARLSPGQWLLLLMLLLAEAAVLALVLVGA